MAEFWLVQGLGNQVLEVVKEAYDLRDVKHDLETIVEAVYNNWSYEASVYLDRELLEKYPTINDVAQFVSGLSALSPYQNSTEKTNVPQHTEKLQFDYICILCDVAIKKKIKKSIKDCIERVD